MALRRRRSGSVVGLSGGWNGLATEMAVRSVLLRQRRGGEREMKRGRKGRQRAHGEAPPGADLAVSGKAAPHSSHLPSPAMHMLFVCQFIGQIFNWKTQRRWRNGHGDPGVGRRR
ncbi:hypothetical protein VPH35_123031 [Triticum aestivum]